MILEKPCLEFTNLRVFAIKLVDQEIEINKMTVHAHEVEVTTNVCHVMKRFWEPIEWVDEFTEIYDGTIGYID